MDKDDRFIFNMAKMVFPTLIMIMLFPFSLFFLPMYLDYLRDINKKD